MALLVGGVAAWSLPVWNIVVNPYQIFNGNLSIGERYTSSTTNERFLKVEHLLKARKENSIKEGTVSMINDGQKEVTPRTKNTVRVLNDSFLVGSSIMGLVNPSIVDKIYPGLHFYNLSFLAAKPDEILASLAALQRGGVKMKAVVYGLEPIAFTDIKSYGPAHELHPEASGKNSGRVVFDYLFATSLSDGFGRLVNTINADTSVKYDIGGAGRYYLIRYDKEIQQDHEAFMLKQFPIQSKPVKAPPWIDSRFEDLRKLVQWLKHENIDATFYLNPLHPYIVDAYGFGHLTEFKQKITLMTGSNVNDCTRLLKGDDVNREFYDYKHFRPEAAGKVIACGLGR